MSRRIDLSELQSVRQWRESPVPQPGWLSFLTHRVGLDATLVVARFLWPEFAEQAVGDDVDYGPAVRFFPEPDAA